MAFTYDPATDRGKVRLLIPDAVEAKAFYSDEEIDTFLVMEGDVRKAAALALETIASSQALVLKRITLLDLTTDGPAVAEELRARAAELRVQSEEDGAFDIANWAVDDFTARRIIVEDLT